MILLLKAFGTVAKARVEAMNVLSEVVKKIESADRILGLYKDDLELEACSVRIWTSILAVIE